MYTYARLCYKCGIRTLTHRHGCHSLLNCAQKTCRSWAANGVLALLRNSECPGMLLFTPSVTGSVCCLRSADHVVKRQTAHVLGNSVKVVHAKTSNPSPFSPPIQLIPKMTTGKSQTAKKTWTCQIPLHPVFCLGSPAKHRSSTPKH